MDVSSLALIGRGRGKRSEAVPTPDITANAVITTSTNLPV
jgi:hypothetical protein